MILKNSFIYLLFFLGLLIGACKKITSDEQFKQNGVLGVASVFKSVKKMDTFEPLASFSYDDFNNKHHSKGSFLCPESASGMLLPIIYLRDNPEEVKFITKANMGYFTGVDYKGLALDDLIKICELNNADSALSYLNQKVSFGWHLDKRKLIISSHIELFDIHYIQNEGLSIGKVQIESKIEGASINNNKSIANNNMSAQLFGSLISEDEKNMVFSGLNYENALVELERLGFKKIEQFDGDVKIYNNENYMFVFNDAINGILKNFIANSDTSKGKINVPHTMKNVSIFTKEAPFFKLVLNAMKNRK